MTEKSKKVVLIWRWTLLPLSETFIRNQFDSYRDWTPTMVGADRNESANSRSSDSILFGAGPVERLARMAFRVFDFSPRLRRLIDRRSPKVLHAHFAIDGMRLRRVSRRRNIPLIVTLHGSDVTVNPARKGMRGVRYRRRLAKLFRDAHLLIAVSEHIARVAIELGAPSKNLVTLPLGVPDIAVVDEAEQAREGLLFVGRLVEKKGVDDLISAVAGMSSALKESTRVTIIGDGPLRGELERAAHLLDVDVEFKGVQSPEVVRSCMSTATALVVPSKTAENGDTEGLPTSVFEALRAATPVVGYRHAGNPEAVQHEVTGLLAPEGNVSQLREYMEAITNDSEMARDLGRAARRDFQHRFDMENQTKKLEALYDSLL